LLLPLPFGFSSSSSSSSSSNCSSFVDFPFFAVPFAFFVLLVTSSSFAAFPTL